MSIKNLSEISSLVTKNKGFANFQLDENEHNAESTKYLRLIDGLVKGGWDNDNDAEREI
ncbi:MAG: hypothetical protein RL090_1220, partial [Bacteroidota bacterium]